MELIKKDVHMNQMGSRQELQVTLDYDFNVPDIKPDVDKIVRQQGNVVVADTKMTQNRYVIDGNLVFSVLYVSFKDEHMVQGITGKLPFSESVVWEEKNKGEVNVRTVLEDLSIVLVNSRKLSIRCIVTFICESINETNLNIAVDVDKGSDDVFCVEKKSKRINISKLKVSTKDIFRVKQELPLSNGAGNISEIMYSDVTLGCYDIRFTENSMALSGTLSMFALYVSDNGEIEFMDKEITFNGSTEVPGVSDDMTPEVEVFVQSFEVNAKPDLDGEIRNVEVDAVLSLNIKAYEDEQLNILTDCYSTKAGIELTTKDVVFENVIMRNTSKIRMVEKMELANAKPPVLLICKSLGEVKIDTVEIEEEGVRVLGALEVIVLYVSKEDQSPINSVKGVFAYNQLIEMNKIKEDSLVRLSSCADSVTVNVMDATHLEVKAQISLSAIAFNLVSEKIITDCEVVEVNPEFKKLPGIIGYIVRKGDSLWEIAKKFNTTVDSIKKVNSLEKDDIFPGDKLVIVTE